MAGLCAHDPSVSENIVGGVVNAVHTRSRQFSSRECHQVTFQSHDGYHSRVHSHAVTSASPKGKSHHIMPTTVKSDAPPYPRVMFIAPGEGTEYSVLGHVNLCLLSEEQTGGAFSLFHGTIPPGGGPPPHIHGREDETFYVLSGRFEFQDGDCRSAVLPGTCVHAPRGSLHTFRNVGPTPGTFLVVITPGGFERFFAEMSGLPPGPPDMARLLEIAARHQIRYAAPPPA